MFRLGLVGWFPVAFKSPWGEGLMMVFVIDCGSSLLLTFAFLFSFLCLFVFVGWLVFFYFWLYICSYIYGSLESVRISKICFEEQGHVGYLVLNLLRVLWIFSLAVSSERQFWQTNYRSVL